jgi:predicted TIM-barrel fold metal-dependent hydrolase
MIIDCHMHVKNGDIYRQESKAEEIVAVMDKCGIDKAIVFAMCISTRDATEMVFKEVQKFPDRLIGFTYARPCYNRKVTEDIRYAIEERGMKGIKIHRGETLLHAEVIGPVLETAIEYGVPCLIDSGNDYAAIESIVKAYPDLLLILAHLGAPSGNVLLIDQFIELARKNKNVYLDTAYVPTYWKIKDAVRILGPEKVLFGSDGILLDPRTEMKKIEVLDLTKEETEYVMGKNIARLLRLN